MLASTVKFSTYNRHPTPPPGQPGSSAGPTNQSNQTPATPTHRQDATGPGPSGPNNVPDTTPGTAAPSTTASCRYQDDHQGRRQLIDVPPSSTRRPTLGDGPGSTHHREPRQQETLLRKEVIQPHLPVRLPCYDLVPIASPTFDGSPHKGWATGFGCYRLS